MTIAVLHPGAMGTALAVTLGHAVTWVPGGRSETTAERARAAHMTPADPLAADVTLPVRGPHAAAEVHRG